MITENKTKKVVKSKIKTVKSIIEPYRVSYINEQNEVLDDVYCIEKKSIDIILNKLDEIEGLRSYFHSNLDNITDTVGSIQILHSTPKRKGLILSVLVKEEVEEVEEEVKEVKQEEEVEEVKQEEEVEEEVKEVEEEVEEVEEEVEEVQDNNPIIESIRLDNLINQFENTEIIKVLQEFCETKNLIIKDNKHYTMIYKREQNKKRNKMLSEIQFKKKSIRFFINEKHLTEEVTNLSDTEKSSIGEYSFEFTHDIFDNINQSKILEIILNNFRDIINEQ